MLALACQRSMIATQRLATFVAQMSTSTSQPPVSIIGAGIAGLSLACRLQASQIPFRVYEARDAESIGHGYAVTLTRPTIVSLAKVINTSEPELVKTTSADSILGGQGKVMNYFRDVSDHDEAQLIDRELRQAMLKHLSDQNINVDWKHELKSVKAGDRDDATLTFSNDQSATTHLVVDTAGLRAPAFDHNIPNPSKQKTLPYVVYYGSRRVSSKEFQSRLAKHFPDGVNFVERIPKSSDVPYLSIQKIHMPGAEATAEDHKIELRYTYSRIPRDDGTKDKLWRPKRAPNEAKDIPEEFYQEFLQAVDEHFPDWKDFFPNKEALAKDRLLNWHLRLRMSSKEYFQQNTKRDGGYRVIAIGDAAHGLPIVKSKGTCVAVRDAEVLADKIVSGEMGSFYENVDVCKRWYGEAVEGLNRLRALHGLPDHSADEIRDLIGFGSGEVQN